MVTRSRGAGQGWELDDVREIQVKPLHLAFVHALNARIEAAADVNYGSFRTARQEIPRVAIEFTVAESVLLPMEYAL